MKSTGIWLLAGTVVLAAACGGDKRAAEQTQAGSGTPVATTGAGGASAFVQEQLALGSKQQGLAQLAAERASRADVKAFAAELVKGHQQTYAPLEQVAREHRITIPESEQLRVERERLAAISGDRFDREYLTEIISDHEDAISDLERAAREGDASIRGWASQTLPTLRRHLEAARRLQQGGTGSGGLP